MFIILSVLYTRRSGVPDVIDMKADTPEDVVRHRVDFFNKFNVGRGVNLQQVVSQCQYLIQQWTRYCSHQQPPLTRASCGGEGPFETLQKSWLLSIVKDPVFTGYEFFSRHSWYVICAPQDRYCIETWLLTIGVAR